MTGLAHKEKIEGREITYCVECGARHSIGPDLEQSERGCMCGGNLKMAKRMDWAELEEYAFEWGKTQ